MKTIQTTDAPAAIGPYSQAIAIGHLLFTSGQIPLRADGTLNDGDITAQTTQVLANLKAVIEAAGGSLSKVVKTTVFMKKLAAKRRLTVLLFVGLIFLRVSLPIGRIIPLYPTYSLVLLLGRLVRRRESMKRAMIISTNCR